MPRTRVSLPHDDNDVNIVLFILITGNDPPTLTDIIDENNQYFIKYIGEGVTISL